MLLQISKLIISDPLCAHIQDVIRNILIYVWSIFMN